MKKRGNKQFKVLLNDNELALIAFLKEHHGLDACKLIRYLLQKEYSEIISYTGGL